MPRTISAISSELLAHLRRDALIGFPNPARAGCPDQALLKAMAYRQRVMDLTQLPVSHIASCSPCFREYSRFRKAAQHKRIAKVLVAIAASILLVAGAITYWPRRVPNESPRLADTPLPAPAPLATVMVNLASLTRTRGGGTEIARLTLPAKRFIGHIQMPIGSEPGLYEVRVARADNSAVVETNVQAQLSDGITSFDIELPLDTLKGNNLTLLVRPAGLSWQPYPIFVE